MEMGRSARGKKRRWKSFSRSQCFCLCLTRDTGMFWSSASVGARVQRLSLTGAVGGGGDVQ